MDNNYFGNICYCRKCNGIVHTIKKGDTLYLLSRYYNVPIGEIMNANRNMNVYNLRIGDELCIPIRRSDMLRDTINESSMEESTPSDNISSTSTDNSYEEDFSGNSFDENILMSDLINQKDMTFAKFLRMIQN